VDDSIENIIFDLGGVILNIDYQLTEKAFISLGLQDFSRMYTQAAQTGLFDNYEKGNCSTPYFINALLDFLPPNTSANKVVAAWNAMILEFPTKNLHLLQRLKSEYRIFLLSNTNDIHLQAVNRALQRVSNENNLSGFFEKTYYSFEIGMRKPDAEIFNKVCLENDLEFDKTLFIDDTEKHILGAKEIGLKTHLFAAGTTLDQLFS
jgi:HAD superfamily hydrolase (TIGR01509 family)